ncbi:MAG: YbjQ family protein [Methanomicrobiales archaeon]
MLMVTTQTIEGKKINKYLGIVTGDSLLGANMYKDLFSGVRDVVGGRTSKYEEELTSARKLAMDSMQEKAKKKGANAIIGTRVAYHNLGGTMGNTIMVTVTGTAISYQE